MATVTYKPFIDRLIQKYEGGYGWDKKDPGGPTKYGITCFDLAAKRGQKMTSMAAWAPIVKAMPLAEAEEIYQTKYAAGIRFFELPPGVDTLMMDYDVNSGVGRPIRVARALLGQGSGDRMGDALVTALQHTDPIKFIDDMCDERLRFMHAIRHGDAWREFGKGWGTRVADLRAYSRHLAQGGLVHAAPPAPDLSNVPTPKASHDDPTLVTKTVKNVAVGSATSSGGFVMGGIHHPGILLAVAAVPIVVGVGYVLYKQAHAEHLNNQVHLK